jgi:cytosine/adenosine deaminase-related metal-dependent hydrolase
MNEEQIADIWMTFKEYLDKKHIENAAERFVDLMADYGVSDEVFKESFGHCSYLDTAIRYYLEIDEEDYDDWDD